MRVGRLLVCSDNQLVVVVVAVAAGGAVVVVVAAAAGLAGGAVAAVALRQQEDLLSCQLSTRGERADNRKLLLQLQLLHRHRDTRSECSMASATLL